MCICRSGEFGADILDILDRKLVLSNSQSDIDPFLFFFLENALLNELLS